MMMSLGIFSPPELRVGIESEIVVDLENDDIYPHFSELRDDRYQPNDLGIGVITQQVYGLPFFSRGRADVCLW